MTLNHPAPVLLPTEPRRSERMYKRLAFALPALFKNEAWLSPDEKFHGMVMVYEDAKTGLIVRDVEQFEKWIASIEAKP